MNPALRVLKNSTALSFSILIERGVAFLLPFYIARKEGVDIWGTYNTVLPFILIAVPFATWGLDQLLPREIARRPQEVNAYVTNAAIISGLSSLIITIVMALVVVWLDYDPLLTRLIVLAVVLNILPRAEGTIFESTIFGLEKMGWVAATRIPLTIVRTILSIVLLEMGYGLASLFFLLSIYFVCLISIYLFLFYTKITDFHFKIVKEMIRPLAIQSLPFVFIVFTGEAFRQLDRIFISKLWDIKAVGIYSTGMLLIQIAYLLIPAVMNALFPGLSRIYLVSVQRFARLTAQLFKFLLIGIFPVVILLISLAGWVIPFVFGTKYLDSVIVLRIATLSLLPAYLARLLYRVMLSSNHERLAGKTVAIRGLVNLILTATFISRYGVVGGSLAMVGTELVALTQNLFFVNRDIMTFEFRYALLRPGFSVLLGLIVYVALLRVGFVTAGLVTITLFFLSLWVTKAINIPELKDFMTQRSP